MGDVDSVLDAIDDVRKAYDIYDDDSSCYSLEMQSLAGLELTTVDEMNLMACGLNANTTATTLTTVGVTLQNAAK